MSKRLRMVVELEPGEPVSGSVALEGQEQIPFEGMLRFLTLFDRLRRPEETDEPEGE